MRVALLGSGSYKSSLTFYRLGAIGRQLARQGWECTMIVPSADKYNNFTPDRNPHIDGISIKQPWQPATRNQIANLIPYIFTASWSLLSLRPQLIYLYKPTPITIIGLIPRLLFKIPLLLDLDDLGSEVMRQEGQPAIMVKLVAWCERTALRHSTAVVVTTTFLAATVKQRYPKKPVLIMSNGVDPEDYPLMPKTDDNPSLYYFGALNRLSLIEPLLNALPATLAAVPTAQVHILGDGMYRADAEALSRKLGIAEHTHFHGYVDKSRFANIIRYGDIALCTQPDIVTVRAASNLKVFQYMSLGSVLVVSDVGDLASYVGGSEPVGIAVPAGDERKLAETLIYLLTHQQERLRMAAAARTRAETVYSWNTLGDRLQQFITKYTGIRADALPAGEPK